ncbi:hypothetical protein ACFL27_05050 [candidate division CSSED10-310 bacterium]|uniref:Photosynthesis system II assembly factor Ycf48/Hcf136-like domain-containing protein n=1 Tax=candidate division CSSED10-310 bacterium TaxID=2855610 RepID=A0ABV6YTM7_UNCC1
MRKFFAAHSLGIFLSFYLLTLIIHLLWYQTFPAMILLSKIIMIISFLGLTHYRPDYGVYLFSATIIIFGASGEFHRLFQAVPFTVFFLFILLARVFSTAKNREYFRERVMGSPLSLPIFLIGIVIPLLGMLTGLYNQNNKLFLFKDVDGWIFYLYFFCLIGLIKNGNQSKKLIYFVVYSTITVAFILSSLNIMILFKFITPKTVDNLLYKTLQLGGHISYIKGGFWRIYTGNAILLSYALSFVVIVMLLKKRVFAVFLFFLFIVLVYSLAVSYTRGYWLSGVITLFLIFLCIPLKQKVAVLAVFLVILGIFMNVFQISPFTYLRREIRTVYTAVFYFSRIETEYAVVHGSGLFKSTDSGVSWEWLKDGLPQSRKIQALDIDPHNEQTIYAVAGGNIFKSIDGGRTWSAKNRGLLKHNIRILTLDPAQATLIYALASGGRVYRSTDAGEQWSIVPMDRSNRNIKTMLSALRCRKPFYVGVLAGTVYKLRDRSTSLKIKQYRSILQHVLHHPILGYGFGATLPENVTFRKQDDTHPHIFEAGYADLLLKAGITGIVIFLYFVGTVLYRSFQLFRSGSMSVNVVLQVFIFPFVGTLVAFATNPYLYSPFGILPLVLTAFIADHLYFLKFVHQDDTSQEILCAAVSGTFDNPHEQSRPHQGISAGS